MTTALIVAIVAVLAACVGFTIGSLLTSLFGAGVSLKLAKLVADERTPADEPALESAGADA